MNILERMIFSSLNTYDSNIVKVEQVGGDDFSKRKYYITTMLPNGVELRSIMSDSEALEALEKDDTIRDFVDTVYATRLAKMHGYEIEATSNLAMMEIFDRAFKEIMG